MRFALLLVAAAPLADAFGSHPAWHVRGKPPHAARCAVVRLQKRNDAFTDYGDSSMKDINRVGVSDKRQREIDEVRGSPGTALSTGVADRRALPSRAPPAHE